MIILGVVCVLDFRKPHKFYRALRRFCIFYIFFQEMNELSCFLWFVIVGIETHIISRPIDPDPICTVDTTAVLGSWANGESTGQFYLPGLLDGNSPDFICSL